MRGRYLLGLDVGSSSVKAALVDAHSGECAASAFHPGREAPIIAIRAGWAEQDPDSWWEYMKMAVRDVTARAGAAPGDVGAIGISYQMHGLVCVGKDGKPLRPAIIWCDSRAVPYGEGALEGLGREMCLSHLLNFPGNFTASKLAWVRDNEPRVYESIAKAMLPGDYIAMRLSGRATTTVCGLSEGMLWDFRKKAPAGFLMDHLGLSGDLLPEIVPTLGPQGEVTRQAARELGLMEGTPISYRAGDQPNNALSLNVLNPGEIASTAGTSGVVYGVLGKLGCDPESRVNTFAHVNYTREQDRLGALLCINGTGILNAWARRTVAPEGMSYADMNGLAMTAPAGSGGVTVIPFGNGAERMTGNRDTGCSIHGVNFNKHGRAHLLRAAQEGIVFSFCHGMEIMRSMGMDIRRIHAGNANMFLSPVFRETLATVSGAAIELYETDGSVGAARGAGMGCGIYRDSGEAFATLRRLATVEPGERDCGALGEAYQRWKDALGRALA